MYAIMGKKYKRRVHKKTNYNKRLGLLKSGKPRLVARLSNMFINLQYVLHSDNNEISKINLISKTIKKYGWEGSCKSIPACYLTGYLFGKTVAKEKLSKDLIFDIGLHKSQNGGRLFGALKGAVDAGLTLNVNEEIYPSQERIEGKDNKKDALFKKVKSAIDSGFK